MIVCMDLTKNIQEIYSGFWSKQECLLLEKFIENIKKFPSVIGQIETHYLIDAPFLPSIDILKIWFRFIN